VNKVLTLKINKTDSLSFITDIHSKEMDLFNTPFSAYLEVKNKLTKIHKLLVGQEFYDCIGSLQQAIEGKRRIVNKLGNNIDLGLLWNEHTQKIIQAEESGKPVKNWHWEGDFLVLFFNHADGENSCVTFLYNDDNGNIIFEVSLEYPWFFIENDPDISYENWLSQYKTFYKTIISKDVAMKWIEQMAMFRDKLDANMTCCKNK